MWGRRAGKIFPFPLGSLDTLHGLLSPLKTKMGDVRSIENPTKNIWGCEQSMGSKHRHSLGLKGALRVLNMMT